MPLNEKQKKFCELSRSGKSPSDAARLAGYSSPGYERILMKNSDVRHELGLDGDGIIAGSDEILEMLTSVMRGDVRDPVVVIEQREGRSGKTERRARVIKKAASVKERMSAAEMLARRYGILDGDPADEIDFIGEDELTEDGIGQED